MSSTLQITTSVDYNILEKEYPRLEKDRNHRRGFLAYLSQQFIDDVDKPITYSELKAAYLDFID